MEYYTLKKMIDITKPVKTSDGREVEKLQLLGDDFLVGFVGDHPVIWDLDGDEYTTGRKP